MDFDEKHWLDGRLYAWIIDPFESEIRETISGFIDDGSTVIDVGCGTGTLSFELSEKCKKVIGVDISSKMIRYANNQKERLGCQNVEFIHADGIRLSDVIKERSNYAISSFVVHGLKEENRVGYLKEMKSISESVIIADYITPQPRNLMGILNRISELFEGIYFTNFKSYIKRGGLEPLLDQSGLKVEKEILDSSKTYRVVKAH